MRPASQLFLPDPFSRSRIPRKRLTNRKALSLIHKIVNDSYKKQTGRILQIQTPDDLGINSRNYLLKAGGGNFVLKHQAFAEDLPMRLRIVKDLRRRSAPFPRIVPTSQGDLYLKQKKQAWYLLEFIAGKHFDGRIDSFFPIGQSVGRLFSDLKNYRKADFSKRGSKGIRTFLPPETLRTFGRLSLDCEKRQGRDFKDPVGKKIFGYWPALKKNYRMARRDWQSIRKFPLQLCHIDLHPHNILVNHNRLAAILDFDSLKYCQPVISLGYGLFKLMKNVVLHNQLAGSKNKVQKITRQFAQSFIDSGALSPSEAKYLKAGARIENVQRFLNVAKRYYNGDFQWSRFIPVFGNALAGELDCVFGPDKS